MSARAALLLVGWIAFWPVGAPRKDKACLPYAATPAGSLALSRSQDMVKCLAREGIVDYRTFSSEAEARAFARPNTFIIKEDE